MTGPFTPLPFVENRESERLAYESELRRIMQRADTLDAEAMLAMRGLIEDIRERILGRVSAEITNGRADQTWGPWWIPRLISSLDDVFESIRLRVGETLAGFVLDSWRLGGELIELPIRAIRPEVGPLTPAVNLMTLTTVAPFSAQLITNVTDSTRSAIDRAIRVNVALGESPSRLMQELSKGPMDRGPWKSMAYRSEIVTRTELSRVQTVAAEARLQQVALDSPGLLAGPHGLKQVFTSVQRGEWPCKICQPLDGTLWDIEDPSKPVPPMHPNCRCMLSPFFPGISRLRTIPDIPSGAQQRASVVECYCCG